MLASKQYFSDGFPKDPHEVLDFIDESIFQDYLGPKEEWLEWLSLASQENIDEFVNTVHDLWIEKNQKTTASIPTPAPAPVSPMQESAPEPQIQQVSEPVQEAVTIPEVVNSIKQEEIIEINNEPTNPVVEESIDQTIEEPIVEENIPQEVINPIKEEVKKPDFVKTEPKIEQTNPFSNPQPAKNVEKNNERQDRNDRSNQSNNSNNQTNNRNQDRQNNQSRANQDNSATNTRQNQLPKDMNNTKIDEKALTLQDDSKVVNYKSFDIKKVRETATKLELDQVYKAYLTSKDDFANVEKAYFESQSALFDKLMTIVVNFEQVADYFESMTEKLLDMNEKIIGQGRELQAVKSSLVSKNQDLEDKTQILESDIQRVERDLRDTKSVNSRRYQELSEVASRINNDSFGDEVTIKSRMDLIDAKIAKLNNQLNASSKIASLTSIASEANAKKKTN